MAISKATDPNRSSNNAKPKILNLENLLKLETFTFNRLVINFLLIIGGLILAISLAEIALRIAGITYPNWYVLDEHTGIALRPGAEGYHPFEGGADVYINSQGLRDEEHTKTKPANTVRIAVLGDSFAAALNVPVEDTFWKVMEGELGTCKNLHEQQVEVINFAVPGYGTTEALLTLRYRVWDYDPDIVLLAFFPGNDVMENSRRLSRNEMVPYFVFNDKGELIPDISFLDSPAYKLRQTSVAQLGYWFKSHLRVVQVVSEARDALKSRAKVAQNQNSNNDDDSAVEVGLSDAIYFEPIDPVWQEAWQVTERLIDTMQDETVNKGAKFLLVTVTMGLQVHPDPAIRQRFMEQLGVSDLSYPNRRLEELARREGFLIVNLVPPFRAYAEENQLFLQGNQDNQGQGHWNIQGHHLAGKIVASTLCQQMLTN